MKDLIVVLEDEEDLLELLEYRLGCEGFDVIGCVKTSSAKKILLEEDVALLLVDRNLRGEEGADFVKKIRKEGYQTPVIYLTARDAREDKIAGFESGGDDYITKPFDFDELLMRLKAIIRRHKGHLEASIYKYKNLSLDFQNHSASIDDTTIALTPLETKILAIFLKNTGRCLSREYLLEEIWHSDGELKSINVAIKRLRKKLDKSDEEKYIKTIRGEGYLFA
ncbi:response regulator transcription factor [Helicobacter sp. 11S02596-1]|uniref:response regulator transcription factor n=1 Tax=Helicobacter sp. 11S02596-1 TaxID=1476194 RepID=UPI000BA619A2|nr:response regulator transcription factor [Helicobacter sp. 11S02596-1]PAF43549.1 DNA-binding response regulator [Helicobacter sp. 11S02596-1]